MKTQLEMDNLAEKTYLDREDSEKCCRKFIALGNNSRTYINCL